ncbi:MAG: ribosome-associated translation inhibitor RaiA [Thermotogae bacterium]|nr:ribosome-associated translation inhibitor RaiA [Thermotogaceae bacterium]RKX37817.1 MAG: ribosome-associated translation inhibitor RaiA [Thermotogota bacterium]
MQYKFMTRGFESTDAIRNYIDRRFEKIDRVLTDDDVVSAEVRAERDAESYKVKAKINLRGNIIVVQEKNPDLYAAIDGLADSLEKKIKKEKATLRDRHRKTASKDTELREETSFEEGQITDVKRFSLSIMSPEEALLQMKVLDRQFFVFRNSETNEINIVYKKKDGTCAVIEFIG